MGYFDTHYIISHDFMSCKCPPLVKRGKKDEKSVFCIVVRSFSSVTVYYLCQAHKAHHLNYEELYFVGLIPIKE